MNLQKFKPAVMNRRPGGKTPHDAGWLAGVVSAVKNGTAAELKRLSIAYHGVGPHMQDDLSAPIEARPSVEPAEPQDIPNVDDQVRTVDDKPYPTTFGHHSPNKTATVPATNGASAAPLPVDPFATGKK
jgi:hypothetical protein